MNENIKFCLVIAFSYLTNFFYIVNRKKSNNISNVNAKVIRILDLHFFILEDPIFENIIYDG